MSQIPLTRAGAERLKAELDRLKEEGTSGRD